MNINQSLLEAISRNEKWILTKCKFCELKPEKADELFQEIVLNLYTSNANFCKKEIESPDAWVKKIATNVTSTHINRAMMDKNSVSIEIHPITETVNCNAESKHDLGVAINYIKSEFKERDREMMFLYFLKESQSSIAEIIGMEVKSVTNRISILKKQLNDYLNRGL
jgi:RNA polymerase sigma factor (sigma-70 family)